MTNVLSPVRHSSSLDDIRKRALLNRTASARDVKPDANSERNAEIWNKEFEELWPIICETID